MLEPFVVFEVDLLFIRLQSSNWLREFRKISLHVIFQYAFAWDEKYLFFLTFIFGAVYRQAYSFLMFNYLQIFIELLIKRFVQRKISYSNQMQSDIAQSQFIINKKIQKNHSIKYTEEQMKKRSLLSLIFRNRSSKVRNHIALNKLKYHLYSLIISIIMVLSTTMSIMSLAFKAFIIALAFQPFLSTSLEVIVLSNITSTVLTAPAGLTVGIQTQYTGWEPNYLGNGAEWIGINGIDEPPGGTSLTFSANFYAYCTANSALFQVKADDSFTAYLNNVAVLSGNVYTTKYQSNVFLACGLNKLTINLWSGSLSMALIFSISQNLSSCPSCCMNIITNCVTCQNETYCNSCQNSSLYLASDHLACINCSNSMAHCVNCLTPTYCVSCLSPTMFISSNHAQCLYCQDYIPDCATCLSDTYCLSCLNLNQFVAADHSGCLNCGDYISNCYTCLSASHCTLCNSISLFVSASFTKCLVCDQYIESCLVCISQTVCQICQSSSTYLTSNRSACLPCNFSLPNCLQCFNSSACFICNNETVLFLNRQCKHCQEVMTYCINCNISSQCIECLSYTFLADDNTQCLLCNMFMEYCNQCFDGENCTKCYVGEVVLGGCTRIVGCTQVQQTLGVGFPSSHCIQCNSTQFILDYFSNICICRQGRLVGHYCIDDPGCIATQMINQTVTCIKCNSFNRFFLNNLTHHCQCSQGFSLSASNVCIDICGDGRVVDNQCDDGNTLNNDGCSRTCKVEPKFRCIDAVNSPSICIFSDIHLNIQLSNIEKGGLNQGIFTFNFFPFPPQLQNFNISNYFFFACCSEIISSVEWRLENGHVVAIVNYLSDLEGIIGLVNFTFDQNQLRHTPILIQFLIHSKRNHLIFQTEITEANLLNYFFFAISLLSLILLLLGSWVHKMVGVQFIHPLQIIYFVHFAFSKYTLPIGSIKYLSLVALTNLFWKKEGQTVVMFQDYQKINFSIEDAEYSLLILLSPILICLIVLLIHFTVKKCDSEGTMALKILKKIYEGIIFAFSLGFLLPSLLVIVTLQHQSLSMHILIPLIVASIISLSVMSFLSIINQNQFKFLFISFGEKLSIYQFSEARKYYIPIYQLFYFLSLIFLWLWIRSGLTIFIFVLLGISILIFSWQIKYQPYYLTFDNLSIVFNSGLQIMFLLFFFLRNFEIYQTTTQIDVVICLTLAGLCIICAIFSFIRLFRAMCYSRSYNFQKGQGRSKISLKSQKIANYEIASEEDLALKNMIQKYACQNKLHREALLTQIGQFNENKFPKARLNYEKYDPQIIKIIDQMRANKKENLQKMQRQKYYH